MFGLVLVDNVEIKYPANGHKIKYPAKGRETKYPAKGHKIKYPAKGREIKYPAKGHDSDYVSSFPSGWHATSVVEGVGLFLFALYHVTIIIVLTNMLIAMMSHSFEAIQASAAVSVTFAR